MSKCGIVGCVRFVLHCSVAMCADHMAPHIDECVSRKVNPFGYPRPGDPTEITFNFQNWFWWRGCWRPSA